MGPKITKQGASFPEDEPGTPKLQPGEGGDPTGRRQGGEAQERPGEEGDRFADLNQPPYIDDTRDEQDDEAAEAETYEGDVWTKDALQGECSKRGLPASGTKPELAKRLRDDDQVQDSD